MLDQLHHKVGIPLRLNFLFFDMFQGVVGTKALLTQVRDKNHLELHWLQWQRPLEILIFVQKIASPLPKLHPE